MDFFLIYGVRLYAGYPVTRMSAFRIDSGIIRGLANHVRLFVRVVDSLLVITNGMASIR